MLKHNEKSVELKTVDILTKEKGWNLESIYGQQYSSSNKRIADLVCCDKQENPLIVFEIKDKNKNPDLKKALGEQAVEWAMECEGNPIAYATDGRIIKTWYLNKTKREQIEKELDEKNITDRKERAKIIFENGKPLMLNGQEVEEFITEELAKKYLESDSNEYNDTEIGNVKRTQKELIRVFASVNDKLKLGEGIGKGFQRFGAFCNLLFLKLISEHEEKQENEGKKARIDVNYRWNKFKNKTGQELLDYLKDTVWQYFQDEYGDDIFTPFKITNPQTLQEIVGKLSPLSLSEIDIDVKGEAFEYFLKAYSKQKNNDLGEYFTPRHIVKFMVEIANPQIGEKVYDPFCGTGGMLTESYKYIQKWMEKNGDSQKKLQNQTIYGNDINEDSCRVAKMSMILLGDGQTHIHRRKSLNLLENDYNNEFELIITNMPFGIGTYKNTEKTRCHKHENLLGKSKSKEIKECFDCLKLLKAKKEENDRAKQKLYKYYLKDDLNINSLCIQHCFKTINKNNPNSRIIMIVPQGILSSEKTFDKLREFIYKNSYVEYIISLPRKVFYASSKASILYLTDINSELDDKEYVEEEKWKQLEEQKHVWYYTVENTGFTLNSKREKKEGKNDLGEFQTRFSQIFENRWVFNYEEIIQSILNKDFTKFYKLEMEKMRRNNYISIPSHYSDYNFDTGINLTPLSELVKETDERNKDKQANVWSVTNDRGFVLSEENFKERVASKDTSKYKLVFPNHFAYNPARINVGSINFNESKEIGCVSRSFLTFRVIEEK